MRITTRLRLVSTATVAALLILVALIGVALLEFRDARSDLALIEALDDAAVHLASHRSQYHLYREPRVLAAWQEDKIAFAAQISQAEKELQGADEKRVLLRLRRADDDETAVVRRVVANTEALGAAQVEREAFEELDKRLYSQALVRDSVLRDTIAELARASARRIESGYQRLVLVIGLFLALLAATTIVTAQQIRRLVGSRLAPLRDGVRRISAGDLEHRIAADGDDEFAELARSFNGASERLKTLTEGLEREVLERTAQIVSERDRAQSYLDVAGVMLAVLDRDGRITMINRKGAELLGKRESELVGSDWFECFVPEPEREARRRAFAELMRGTRHVYRTFENRIVAADGRPLVLAWTNALVTDASGAITGLLCSAEDITAHKQAQRLVQESRESLSITLDSIGDAVIATDVNGLVTRMNPAAERLTGWSFAEARGRPLREVLRIFSEATRQPAADPVEQVIARGAVVAMDSGTLLRSRLGTEYSIADSAAPIRNGAGEIVGVVLIFSDVSEKRAMQKALAASEANYRTLFTEMLDGFALHEIIVDGEGRPVDYRFLAVNPAFERLTGLAAAAIVGRRLLEVLPDTEPRWIATYGEVALSGEPALFEDYSAALDKYFEIAAFRPAPGQFATVFADVSARKLAEQTLSKAARLPNG